MPLQRSRRGERAAAILTFALGHEQLLPSYAFAAGPALERLEAELLRKRLRFSCWALAKSFPLTQG